MGVLAPVCFPGCLQVTESLEKFLVKCCRDGRVRELEKARFGERTSQGISVDFGQSQPLSTAERGTRGRWPQERWVSKMEAHSSPQQ